MRALLKYASFRNRPKKAFILGFLSVYIVWFIPSLFWGWNGWTSFAYTFGDPIILSLFNGIAFYMLSKRKRKIPIWSILVVVPGGLFITFLAPDEFYAMHPGMIGWNITIYHGIFVFFQFSFILFMFMVYPFSKDIFYIQPFLILMLFLLITCFLAFVFGPDDGVNKLPLWIKTTAIGLLWATFIFFVIDRKTNFIESTRIKITSRLRILARMYPN